ncbi:EamA family transporter [Pseudothauera nasutitermitis]|uniref:EamA family transporter n=1 Tax=Pseudothauera nasutitermitis TaxID=2565930 RepID=A0A4S4AVC3_9RHOO|nr:EamA family transporter [Pseudothauera nasutitermitis]THF63967.1 EamA family transporter [Pseudothauera nasutitermitis]
MDGRKVWLADLALLAAAVVWGTSYGTTKEALNHYPVLAFVALRMLATGALLAPAVLRAGAAQWPALLRVGVPTGLLLLAIFLCETFGVFRTTASNAAFLISLCVILTPFAEWLLLGRRPARTVFLAACVSVAGVWLLTGGARLDALNLGDALILAAAVLRAGMVVLTRRLTAGKHFSSLALTAVQTVVVGIGSLCAALALLPAGAFALPEAPSFWLYTGYLVLFCTVFAFFAQNYALRRTTPTRAALLMGSEPLFGALFAIAFVGERLSALAWLGGGLVCAATLWVALGRGSAAGGGAERVRA